MGTFKDGGGELDERYIEGVLVLGIQDVQYVIFGSSDDQLIRAIKFSEARMNIRVSGDQWRFISIGTVKYPR